MCLDNVCMILSNSVDLLEIMDYLQDTNTLNIRKGARVLSDNPRNQYELQSEIHTSLDNLFGMYSGKHQKFFSI